MGGLGLVMNEATTQEYAVEQHTDKYNQTPAHTRHTHDTHIHTPTQPRVAATHAAYQESGMLLAISSVGLSSS